MHALIFSKDTVGLKTRLRQDSRPTGSTGSTQKGFFCVAPGEVRDALKRYAGEHAVEFSEVPQVLEWRLSAAGRNA
ncbi:MULTISPECIES: hypothetical protein [unclassified Streptomyces]|uniref:hypothetical protein n=1 Tax=unclassified Streptomyces TaxID=2593676 RepID=UPI0033BBABC7